MSNIIKVDLKDNGYEVIIEKGGLNNLYKFIDVDRDVFIITDKNVEKLYLETVKSQFITSNSFVISPGEASKSFIDLIAIINYMQSVNIKRNTLLIGLGGGVVGDIAGLVAALYLRGLDYIAIPTTTLAQTDSSVGGKVAINLNCVKNVVGTFYQPKKVIVDINTLSTLANLQYNDGIVEAVKIGLLLDADLFNLILKKDIKENISEIIEKSIIAKAKIVEKDEKDQGVRNLLNFGHTLGHALESLHKFSHGQSVLLGMIYTTNNLKIKKDLIDIAKKLDLIYEIDMSDDLYDLMTFDKKIDKSHILLAHVEEIGKGFLKKHPITYLWEIINVK